MTYPVLTVMGETVQIIEKYVETGTTPHESTVLVSDDGRKFSPTENGLRVVEIDPQEAADDRRPPFEHTYEPYDPTGEVGAA